MQSVVEKPIDLTRMPLVTLITESDNLSCQIVSTNHLRPSCKKQVTGSIEMVNTLCNGLKLA